MELPLAISPVNATFWLAVFVLVAAVILSLVAAVNEGENSKQLFAIVGVLLGLFGAGGLGALFANQAANEAASKAAPQAVEEAEAASQAEVEAEGGASSVPRGGSGKATPKENEQKGKKSTP